MLYDFLNKAILPLFQSVLIKADNIKDEDILFDINLDFEPTKYVRKNGKTDYAQTIEENRNKIFLDEKFWKKGK